MTQSNTDIPRRGPSLRLPLRIAVCAVLALGAVAGTADAQGRGGHGGGGHGGGGHGGGRGGGHIRGGFRGGGGWGGGFYPSPPLIYGDPYYCAPPLIWTFATGNGYCY